MRDLLEIRHVIGVERFAQSLGVEFMTSQEKFDELRVFLLIPADA